MTEKCTWSQMVSFSAGSDVALPDILWSMQRRQSSYYQAVLIYTTIYGNLHINKYSSVKNGANSHIAKTTVQW